MKIINILEGRINQKNKTPIPEDRLKACLSCPHNVKAPIKQLYAEDEIEGISGRICDVCMCPLPYKLRSKDEHCPLGKW